VVDCGFGRFQLDGLGEKWSKLDGCRFEVTSELEAAHASLESESAVSAART
jgi:hypothetical protein